MKWGIMKRSYFNKAKADVDHQTDSAPFFIEKGVLSAGWSFKDTPEMMVEAVEKIQSFSDYRKFFDETSNKLGWNKKWNNQSVHYLFDNLQAGDFVWLKNKGTYWVTQVPQDPKSMFKFDMSEQFMAADAVAHIGPLEWIEVGGEDTVPGSVTTAKGRLQAAMQRIDNGDESIEFGDDVYTTTSLIAKSAIDKHNNISLIKSEIPKTQIFNLMGAIGLEDLVAFWLYSEYGYVVIPSTNKISTELYEFVMVDARGRTGKKIYLQTKNGKVDLYTSDYKHLLRDGVNDEVWLVSRLGAIDGDSTLHFVRLTHETVERHNLNELISFIFSKDNEAILPPLVQVWLDKFEWK